MAHVRRHLLKANARDPARRRAACGLLNPTNYTQNPDDVTCLTCQGSLYMADLEFRMSNPQQPKRRKRRETN
jgi:hypothetical protein